MALRSLVKKVSGDYEYVPWSFKIIGFIVKGINFGRISFLSVGFTLVAVQILNSDTII